MFSFFSKVKQLARRKCKSSHSQAACGILQPSLEGNQVGHIQTCTSKARKNSKINDELVDFMASAGEGKRADVPVKMQTLLFRLSSVDKGTSYVKQLSIPNNWTLAKLREHLLLGHMMSDTPSMPCDDKVVSLMIYDRPLLGSNVKLCDLEPYTVITCQVSQ